VILSEVNLIFVDEPEIVSEVFYKIEYISIFAWFLIPGVKHYHWLCDLIRQLPSNKKVNYLVHTIRCILNFLKLWITIMA
jgi:hypothetical protein